jgi:hypothetical protein
MSLLLLGCVVAPAANAQRTVTLYGAAKIDLAPALYIATYNDGLSDLLGSFFFTKATGIFELCPLAPSSACLEKDRM